MAVEVRYHVLRDGKEVAMYTTKKEADEHDKMLDIADNLFQFIQKADNIQLEEDVLEDLTIYLARNRADALTILKGVKPKQVPKKTVKIDPEKVSPTVKGKSKVAKAG